MEKYIFEFKTSQVKLKLKNGSHFQREAREHYFGKGLDPWSCGCGSRPLVVSLNPSCQYCSAL